MTLAEIRFGMFKSNWGAKRVLEMETFILHNFTVIYPTDSIVSYYSFCLSSSINLGKPLSHGDAWIAATALELECPLATHNAKDYAVLGDQIKF